MLARHVLLVVAPYLYSSYISRNVLFDLLAIGRVVPRYGERLILFRLLAIGRVVPRYGERLICKWKEVRNQTQD